MFFLPTRVFGSFQGNFSVIKLSVSIFGQTTGYSIYTVSREPIRLPEIQLPFRKSVSKDFQQESNVEKFRHRRNPQKTF